MEQFGCLWVSGVGGSVESRFRRAISLTLGPIAIQRWVDVPISASAFATFEGPLLPSYTAQADAASARTPLQTTFYGDGLGRHSHRVHGEGGWNHWV
jgi:hypothetical protein